MSIRVRFRALTGGRVLTKSREMIDDIEEYQQSYLEEIINKVRNYPPVPPESTYIRTYTLFRSWRVETYRRSDAMYAYILNYAMDPSGSFYATYVQGDWQVGYHAANGWKNINDYLDRREYIRGLMRVIRSHTRNKYFDMGGG